jgi:AcrR family transcriptional regulator
MDVARLTPAAIVRAAAELADAGDGAITMSETARRLGVRTASLYGHVRDQRAVVDGVHELALGELADEIADGIAGRSGDAAVRGLAEAMRGYAAAHPGRWAVLQSPAGESVRASDAARRVAGLTAAVLRGYDLGDDDVVHATRMLGAAVNGFLTLDGAGSFAGREPAPSASWDRMLAALGATFRSWARPHDPTEEVSR